MNKNFSKFMNLLIVDDEQELLTVLSDVIKDNFYQVFTATDGVSALDYLQKHNIDIVVSDLKMPNMDGLKFFKTINESVDPNIVKLVITGYPDLDSAVEAYEYGVLSYILKPFTLTAFENALDVAVLRRIQILDEERQILEVLNPDNIESGMKKLQEQKDSDEYIKKAISILNLKRTNYLNLKTNLKFIFKK